MTIAEERKSVPNLYKPIITICITCFTLRISLATNDFILSKLEDKVLHSYLLIGAGKLELMYPMRYSLLKRPTESSSVILVTYWMRLSFCILLILNRWNWLYAYKRIDYLIPRPGLHFGWKWKNLPLPDGEYSQDNRPIIFYILYYNSTTSQNDYIHMLPIL